MWYLIWGVSVFCVVKLVVSIMARQEKSAANNFDN